MALRIGDLLNNRYLIKQVIASRGETVIYRALDQSTDVEVGIRECLIGSPETRQQLLQEMEVHAGLRQPNLMHLTDHFDIPEKGIYEVTDFVDGRKIFQPSPNAEGISFREAVHVILSICDALYYLHHNEPPVVHGEVNLDTICLSPDGQVILIHPQWILAGDYGDRSKTGRLRNQSQDPRTDIHDLAYTLLQLLTGRIAEGNSAKISLEKMIGNTSPPIPDGIALVLSKALHPEIDQRFQHIEDFKAALLNAVIFMPPESASARPAVKAGSKDSQVGTQISRKPPEPTEPGIEQEAPPLAKTPIRRRVPWGLLILELLGAAAVLI